MPQPENPTPPEGEGADVALAPTYAEARAYLECAKAPGTLRAYRADWRHFAAWCGKRGRELFPTAPGVRTPIAGIRRVKGTAPATQKKPLLVADLERPVTACRRTCWERETRRSCCWASPVPPPAVHFRRSHKRIPCSATLMDGMPRFDVDSSFQDPEGTQATAHLAAIVESSDDAIVSKTLNGTILTWNNGAERVYGYTAEEAIGLPMMMMLPADRAEEESAILDRIKRGQKVEHFETVRRTKNGDLIDVSLTISPIIDKSGNIVGASHVARNITERRRLEQRLEQLAAIVESAEDAIISKTLDGIVLTWNAGAQRIYGYRPDEMIGESMTLLLPADRSDEETVILQQIRHGQRVEHFETVRRRREGDTIDVSLTISPVRDRSGSIVAASHVARDVTERRRIDEQLRHTQKLESLGVLAGGIAHDFNNLLTGILGNASLASEALAPHHPVRKLLSDVVTASERAAHLTKQLLAYAGKGRFLVEPLDLSRSVREIAALIQASIPKNVHLRLDLREGLPMMLADAIQVQQIVMNLVINGAEAIGENQTGTVLVTTSVQAVDTHYLTSTLGGTSDVTEGTYLVLEVHDDGCGMDDITIGRIFDPFFTTKFAGRGLGLAAVQGIVRGHKGVMKVYSTLGRGTTFKVLFPATDQPAPTTEDLLLPADGAHELILVVDDEDIIRRTAKSMLERYGYTVLVAENGRQAVELFKVLGDKVGLVLLDMTMPVMGGEETFSQLRALRPDIKVILSSGYNEVETIRRFTGKGLAGFIQKPYSSFTLGEKVSSVLNGSF